MNKQTSFSHLNFVGLPILVTLNRLIWEFLLTETPKLTPLGHAAKEKLPPAFFHFFLLHEQYTNSPDLLCS